MSVFNLPIVLFKPFKPFKEFKVRPCKELDDRSNVMQRQIELIHKRFSIKRLTGDTNIFQCNDELLSHSIAEFIHI